MPYRTLPARLRRIIPSADGQELFRNVVNSQLKAGKSESVAMASAWAALQEAGYKKTEGAWVKKSSPTSSAVHVPSTDWDKQDTYRAPAGARAAARRAIRWKEKYGDEVKGGTQVGWTRAGQLARGENLSRSTVARMASFARHRQNATVDPKFKDTPWRDRGHVAWNLWGSDAGVDWAIRTMDRINKRQIDDDSFTMPDEARSRSMEMGLGGEIHVHQADGQQAVYMPGKTHEDYLSSLERLAGIEPEPDDESEGLLERAISAIIGGVMAHENIHKSGTVAILKADDEQRIVWGWAYVSTEDGRLLVDSQGDSIEPAEMVKMADRFMLDVRKAKAMHRGEVVGEFIHSMPLTNELMKLFDIHSDREGWIVAMKVYSDDAWADVKSGKLPMLSIGGRSGAVEEYDAA
jgi:cation transport regulator ChaB